MNEERRIADSLARISDSLTRHLDGFSYLKLGDTYKHICDAAKEHHKPYLRLFKRQYTYEYAEHKYKDDDGHSRSIYLKDIQIKKPKQCSEYGENHIYKDNPNIGESEGAVLLSENIVVYFDLLFFKDSLVKIDFSYKGLKFAKDALEKKYGVGKISANEHEPGIKTNISKRWENDTICVYYHDWVKWDPPYEKIRDCGEILTMTHKILIARMHDDNKRMKDAEAAAKSAERSAAMDNI